MRQEIENMKLRLERAERRFRAMCGLAFVVVAFAVLAASRPAATAQSGGDLAARVAALEAKTQFISVAGEDMFVTGANLHVLNGLGSTNTTNGAGNLIVGYNTSRGERFDVRKGSHNLVLGDQSNFASYGGIVAGQFNEIAAPYASVTGGTANTASANWSAVSGGYSNLASAPSTCVLGGQQNRASSDFCTVSGGLMNTAGGFACSVSGGQFVTQSGDCGWSGGSAGALVTGKLRSP